LTIERGLSTLMPVFNNVLVAVNDSAPAAQAASVAEDLVAACGGKICFVHVADEALENASEDPGVGDRQREEGVAFLEATVARAAQRGIAVETELVTGNVVHEILRIAEQRGADLIVTGTNARHGLARLVLGSVAEGVLHGAHAPVMIVRAPHDAGAAAAD
jgi:nucleotide-binding universal stress UspA family protein